MTKSGWIPLFQTPTRFFKHDAQTISDKEQDIFTFRFGNESGNFVIGKDGSILPIGNTNLKIEKVEEDMTANQIVTRISKFIITTESGIQYIFNDKTLNRIISYETTIPAQFFQEIAYANRTFYMAKTNYRMNDYYSVDNWLLSEIVNPLTGKKITFNYDTYTLNYLAGEDAMQSVEQVDASNYKEVVQWIQRRFNGIIKRISSIQFPNNTSVEFTYFDTERVDLPGDKALKQIVIKENGLEKSGYVFNYLYFSKNTTQAFTYSFPADEVANARLSLLSVQRKGINNYLDKPYTFSYYIGDKSGIYGWVPPRMSATRDHWGYYNANVTYPYDNNLNIYKNLTNLFTERYRVVNNRRCAENGILKTVQYPTGGQLNFEYELNTAWVDNAVEYAGGVRVKKVSQSDAVDNSKLIATEYKYVDEAGNPSSWGYEEPVYADKASSVLVLPGGTDFYAAVMVYNMLPNIVSGALVRLDQMAALKAAQMEQSYAGASLQIMLLTTVISYMTGKLVTSDNIKVQQKTNDVSFSTHPKNVNPLPFLYKRVEVYGGTQTDNVGKVVYSFTSDEDFPLIVPEYKQPYSSRPRCFWSAYGLTKQTKVFNKLNELVKETYNKYNVRVAEQLTGLHHSVKCVPSQTLISADANYSYYSTMIGFFSEDYYPVTGRVELEYTTEKSYSGSEYMMERTDYTYDPVFFDVKKVTTVNSLGETIEKRMYYPYDYNIAGPLTVMKSKNMLDVPVSTETWLTKSGGQQVLVDAEVQDFQQIANGDYKPVNVYNLNADVPVDKTVIGEFDATKLKRSDVYLTLENSYVYNSLGDASQILNRGMLQTNIKDDNSEVTIAGVKNAGINDIAYSSFEERATGNWQIPVGGASMITADVTSPTGKRCLKLAASSVLSKPGLDAAKEYIVSYWYKGGTVAVSGATVVKDITGQTINGWTLKILRIKQTTSLSVSGTAYVDEVRLYPADAKMVTRCYNELMKVNAETAADNTTVYYEYDDLGRLKITRDAQRNIVGLHEYKDKQ
jgi:YD repeat-containing protein